MSTLLQGFGDRLLAEIRKMAPKDIKIRVSIKKINSFYEKIKIKLNFQISAPQERLYSTWIGGSILASLDTFKKMWCSKREYEDDGVKAIHRKTF